jgi:hypothetical protein
MARQSRRHGNNTVRVAKRMVDYICGRIDRESEAMRDRGEPSRRTDRSVLNDYRIDSDGSRVWSF